MVWSPPMTAVAGAVFTAAQFNQFVRDNLNETAPAKATAAGGYMVTNGLNSIVERFPAFAEITASETTVSTSFVDLTTPGPAVTINTGTTAVVIVSGSIMNSGAGAFSLMSPEVSGATSIAADAARSFNTALTTFTQASWVHTFTTLTAGSNTFTMKYAVTANTGTFRRRRITVLPY